MSLGNTHLAPVKSDGKQMRATGPFLFRTSDVDLRAEGPAVRQAQGNALGNGGESILVRRPNGPTVRRENHWPAGPLMVGV